MSFGLSRAHSAQAVHRDALSAVGIRPRTEDAPGDLQWLDVYPKELQTNTDWTRSLAHCLSPDPCFTICDSSTAQESRQNFRSYVLHRKPLEPRRVIYLLSVDRTEYSNMKVLEKGLRAFFHIPMQVLPHQYLKLPQSMQKEEVVGMLKGKGWPSDAFCVVAITSAPRSQVFCKDRCCLLSIAGLGGASSPSNRKSDHTPERPLYTTMPVTDVLKLMQKGIARILRMKTCPFFTCCLGYSVGADLCPVCLRKMHFTVGFDIMERYQQLAQFYSEYQEDFEEEKSWINMRLNYLAKKDVGSTVIIRSEADFDSSPLEKKSTSCKLLRMGSQTKLSSQPSRRASSDMVARHAGSTEVSRRSSTKSEDTSGADTRRTYQRSDGRRVSMIVMTDEDKPLLSVQRPQQGIAQVSPRGQKQAKDGERLAVAIPSQGGVSPRGSKKAKEGERLTVAIPSQGGVVSPRNQKQCKELQRLAKTAPHSPGVVTRRGPIEAPQSVTRTRSGTDSSSKKAKELKPPVAKAKGRARQNTAPCSTTPPCVSLSADQSRLDPLSATQDDIKLHTDAEKNGNPRTPTTEPQKRFVPDPNLQRRSTHMGIYNRPPMSPMIMSANTSADPVEEAEEEAEVAPDDPVMEAEEEAEVAPDDPVMNEPSIMLTLAGDGPCEDVQTHISSLGYLETEDHSTSKPLFSDSSPHLLHSPPSIIDDSSSEGEGEGEGEGAESMDKLDDMVVEDMGYWSGSASNQSDEISETEVNGNAVTEIVESSTEEGSTDEDCDGEAMPLECVLRTLGMHKDNGQWKLQYLDCYPPAIQGNAAMQVSLCKCLLPDSWSFYTTVNGGSKHSETFADYVTSNPPTPTAGKDIVYIVPVTCSTSNMANLANDLEHYVAGVEAFFALPTIALPLVDICGSPVEFVSPNSNPSSNKVDPSDISKLMVTMSARLPSDAYCGLLVILDACMQTVTMSQSDQGSAMGIVSLAKCDPNKGMKVLVRGIADVMGMHVCPCNTCGFSADRNEERFDWTACAICLRKLHWLLGFDILDRYQGLLELVQKHKNMLPRKARLWMLTRYHMLKARDVKETSFPIRDQANLGVDLNSASRSSSLGSSSLTSSITSNMTPNMTPHHSPTFGTRTSPTPAYLTKSSSYTGSLGFPSKSQCSSRTGSNLTSGSHMSSLMSGGYR